MAQTILLDGVTVSGASSVTFTITDYFHTVISEGLSRNDYVRIEKQNIAGAAFNSYKPLGEELFLSYAVRELNLVGKGTYRVNLTTTPDNAVTIASIV